MPFHVEKDYYCLGFTNITNTTSSRSSSSSSILLFRSLLLIFNQDMAIQNKIKRIFFSKSFQIFAFVVGQTHFCLITR